MTRRTSWLGRLLVIPAVAVAAGCSSGHASLATQPPTTASPVATTAAPTTSAPSTPPSSAAPTSTTANPSTSPTGGEVVDPNLDPLLLRQSDLPTGWVTQTASPTSPSDASNAAQLSHCAGAKDTFPDQVGTAASQFGLGQATLNSNASRFMSQADVASDTQILKSPKASPCLTVLLQAALNQDFAGSGITASAVHLVVSPGSAGGPSNIVATSAGSATISTPNGAGTVYIDSVYIAGPKIEVEIDYFGTNPIEPGLFTSLGNVVAGRAAHG